MPFRKNKIIIASAGSRKTTLLVEEALAAPDQKILITTYTNENVAQIKSYFVSKHGYVPKNVSVLSWYSFLLSEGARPYQSMVTNKGRIRTIIFEDAPDALKFVKKTDVDKYFLTSTNDLYRDRVADFVCVCDERTNGAVIGRLSKIYDRIFIDEIQDLAGRDLEILERLLRSPVSVLGVGDPRQGTFSTNNSPRYRQFKRDGIIKWVERQKLERVVTVEERVECYRSNQVICDFADALYPQFRKTVSKNLVVTGHDGVFLVKRSDVKDYVEKQNPIILRYDKRADTMGLAAFNMGSLKGRTFDRVLIFPTKPMKQYLETKDLSKVGDVAKLYVAVTRAKYSVAFVDG